MTVRSRKRKEQANAQLVNRQLKFRNQYREQWRAVVNAVMSPRAP
jgi:hypothetical protein